MSLCVTSRHLAKKSKIKVNMSCACHVGVLGVSEVGGWYVRPEVVDFVLGQDKGV